MVRFLLLLLHHHHHFRKTSLHSWMPVCEQSKDRVLKCYHGNPDHTLNCSSEAKEYMECVEKARQVGWSCILTVGAVRTRATSWFGLFQVCLFFLTLGTATHVVNQ